MSRRVYDQTATEIACRTGDAFELSLEALPSAGYEWRVQVDEARATVTELPAQIGGEDFGGSTRQRFRVEPLASGRTAMRLTYGRPWEAEPEEARTVRLIIAEADAG